MKLDFIVAGFSKCGTTTLCSLMAEHPEICFAKGKEPAFFAERWKKKNWKWYESQYDRLDGHIFGEGSTQYTTGEYCHSASKKILRFFPDVRFIFIARNPLKRLASSYREMHASGYKYGINAPYSLGGTLRKFSNMIEDTLYWKRFNVYRKCVPEDRILVLFLEDFTKNPGAGLTRCLEFVGADPSLAPENSERRENAHETKVYDTRLMRMIRESQWANGLWTRLGEENREWAAQMIGLRRPFKKPVVWDDETREWVLQRIARDSVKFLKFHGKTADFWNLGEWDSQGKVAHRPAA